MLSVLATSLHLPLVDPCWAKKGLIRDGKDTLSVERLYVYIVGLTCRVAWLSCDKQRTTFEGAQRRANVCRGSRPGDFFCLPHRL